MLLSELRQLLNPGVISGLDTTHIMTANVKLKEDNVNAKTKEILVNIPTHNALVFQLDKKTKPHRAVCVKSFFILNCSKKYLNCACDYVIAFIINNKLWFVLCELKSDSVSGATQQLYYSTPFIEYIVSLLKYHCKQTITHEIRYVLFSTNPKLAKTLTRIKPIKVIDKTTGIEYYPLGALTYFSLTNVIN